jgi:DNA polymerase V
MSGYRGDETTGFQSPAQDFVEEVVDLAALLDLSKPGIYPVRVLGRALKERGIDDGDILVTDAAAEPVPGQVCIAMIGGDVIIATLDRRNGAWLLTSSAGLLTPVTEDVEVWAIVRALVRTQV